MLHECKSNLCPVQHLLLFLTVHFKVYDIICTPCKSHLANIFNLHFVFHCPLLTTLSPRVENKIYGIERLTQNQTFLIYLGGLQTLSTYNTKPNNFCGYHKYQSKLSFSQSKLERTQTDSSHKSSKMNQSVSSLACSS